MDAVESSVTVRGKLPVSTSCNSHVKDVSGVKVAEEDPSFIVVVVGTDVRTSLKVEVLFDTMISTAKVELKYVVVCVNGRHLCHAPAVMLKLTGIAYFMAHALKLCVWVMTRSA